MKRYRTGFIGTFFLVLVIGLAVTGNSEFATIADCLIKNVTEVI